MNIFKKKERKKELDGAARTCMLVAVVGNQKVVKMLEDSLVEENTDYDAVIKESIELLNGSIEAINTGIRALT